MLADRAVPKTWHNTHIQTFKSGDDVRPVSKYWIQTCTWEGGVHVTLLCSENQRICKTSKFSHGCRWTQAVLSKMSNHFLLHSFKCTDKNILRGWCFGQMWHAAKRTFRFAGTSRNCNVCWKFNHTVFPLALVNNYYDRCDLLVKTDQEEEESIGPF